MKEIVRELEPNEQVHKMQDAQRKFSRLDHFIKMVRYVLKAPYHDGATHILFEPLGFLSKLAALVANPRVNLTRIMV